MAYLPGYEHDVFVSYSHANNQTGWVSRFRDKLAERLKEFLGDEPDVFLDTSSIHGNDNLDARIDCGIARSAILVPIVSRSYITRAWCQLECREFRAANPEEIRTRIFPARYDDVSPTEFQVHVGPKIGYPFFGKDEKSKYSDTWEHDSDDFKRQMNTLRIEIGELLNELKKSPPSTTATRPAPSQPGRDEARPAVMLAESTRHLQRFRDNLSGFLRGYQIDVIQPGERFYELPRFAEDFDRQLEGVDLFVQLLGRFFDPHDDEAIHSWDQWQYRHCQSAGKPGLRWFHKFDKDNREIDLATLDATHRAFVKGTGVWDNDFELFKQLVLTEAQTNYQLHRQKVRATASETIRPLIVLRSDKSDFEFAEQIGNTLAKQQCEWIRIPDKDVSSLDDFGRECAADGMLVIYRSCPGRWVLTRLQELRKFLKSETGQRWSCGLWRAPEDESEALSCSVDGLIVIEPPDQRQLPQFLETMRQRLAGANP